MFSIEELEDVPVVVARDFLPSSFIEHLYGLIARFQSHFGRPPWSKDPHGTAMDEGKRASLCLGEDIWFPYKDPRDDESRPLVPRLLYEYVEQYVFHQGLMAFLARTRCEAFRLIPEQSPDGRIHLICYGNGGYYNWHRDLALREGPSLYGHTSPRHNLMTFSLCLCLELLTGEINNTLSVVCQRLVSFSRLAERCLIDVRGSGDAGG